MIESSAPQRVWLASILLAVAIAVLYLLFPTRLYYWDGIVFAQTIEDARRLSLSLIHPNHLIYNGIGYLFYKLLSLLGMNVRAIVALQILNSVLSAIIAALLFGVLVRALRSFYLSTFLTLLFAFAATWWKFSTDANAYIASLLFIMLGLGLIRQQRPRPLLVALTFLGSILFHELAVFFGAVLALGLFLQAATKEERVAAVAKFLILAAIGTYLIYGGTFYLVTGKLSPIALFKWITHHSPDSEFTFDPVANLKYVLRGHVRLFFGGRFNLLQGLLSPIIIGLIVILGGATLGFFYSLIRGIRDLPSLRLRISEWSKDRRDFLLLTGVWIVLYELFLFFWLPQNTFYRLFYLPALIVLLGLFIPENVARRYRLALFVVTIGSANFLFLIYPYTHVQKNPPLEFAYQMNSRWTTGTVVLYAVDNSDESLVRYFTPGTVWKKIDTSNTSELDRALAEGTESGKTVWLETTAIDNLSGKNWFETHALKESAAELNNSAYRIRFVQVK